MWTLSDSGFSSRSGLSPLVDLVVLLYEEHNEKMKHIHEIREEIEIIVVRENFLELKKHIGKFSKRHLS